MITVVVQSYLGMYKRAAKDRNRKIVRAINSILAQTVKVEAMIVADGCNKTAQIIKEKFAGRVTGYIIPKQQVWSGVPRNLGIEKARYDTICYLDIDDYLEKTHCERILDNFGKSDWIWFDDMVFSKGTWRTRRCDIDKKGMCGTSNLAHKKYKIWPDKGGYAHDWLAIRNLKQASDNYRYIGHGGYRVCHIPGRIDI